MSNNSTRFKERLIKYYHRLIERTVEEQNFQSLDPEWPQIELSLKYALKDYGYLSSLLKYLSDYLYIRGMYVEWINWETRALVIAREVGDKRGESSHLGNLGSAHYSLEHVEKSEKYHQQALVIAREVGDKRGESSQLGNLGTVYRDLGQIDQAIDHYQQALVIAREVGDKRGESSQLGNLGTVYRDLGQTDQAIDHYQQALTINLEIGYRQGQGILLENLGATYRLLGETNQAINYYEQALAMSRALRNKSYEVHISWILGILYQKTDLAKAIELMTITIAYEREIGHPDTEANAEYVTQLQASLGKSREIIPVEAHERLAQYYLNLAQRTNEKQTYHSFDLDWMQIESLLKTIAQMPESNSNLSSFILALSNYWYTRGFLPEAITWSNKTDKL